MFPSCERDRQSPIDIVDSVAIRQQAEQWQLSGWISENKYEIEYEMHICAPRYIIPFLCFDNKS